MAKSTFKLLAAILLILTASALAAVFMGQVWNGVCWLRSYGLTVGIADQTISSQVLPSVDYGNAFLNAIGQFTDLYNSTFSGNARFGSGLGVIAGALIGLGVVARFMPDIWQRAAFRAVLGLTAGALIGARLVLIITSDPIPFLLGMIPGAISLAIIVVCCKETLPSLTNGVPRSSSTKDRGPGNHHLLQWFVR